MKTAKIYINENLFFTISFETYAIDEGMHVFYKRKNENCRLEITATFPLTHSVVVS